MLASTLIWRPSISSGSASALCSRWATFEASVGSWTLWRITPNSSPPRRAAVSPVRMTDSSCCASVRRAASPAWMPEPVVDALEVVEVDEQQSRLPAGPLAGRDRMVEPLGEMDAVREAGQRIVERLAAELFLRFALRRDVEQIALEMERLCRRRPRRPRPRLGSTPSGRRAREGDTRRSTARESGASSHGRRGRGRGPRDAGA